MSSLNTDVQKGNEFRARTLRDRGPNAPEKLFGADFCGVLNVRFHGFQQSKGFLCQAKMADSWVRVQTGFRSPTRVTFSPTSEFARLQDQVDMMLNVTPDSFVIVYAIDRFVVVPASSVQGLKIKDQLYGKDVVAYFKEYLMCFIGDPRIRAHDDKTLDSIRAKPIPELRSCLKFSR